MPITVSPAIAQPILTPSNQGLTFSSSSSATSSKSPCPIGETDPCPLWMPAIGLPVATPPVVLVSGPGEIVEYMAVGEIVEAVAVGAIVGCTVDLIVGAGVGDSLEAHSREYGDHVGVTVGVAVGHGYVLTVICTCSIKRQRCTASGRSLDSHERRIAARAVSGKYLGLPRV